jgi:hypothetical protein
MSHLPTERLAALVDEPPTGSELAHLASCADCARERASYQTLAELANAESTRIGVPITEWNQLAQRLMADGMIDDGAERVAGRVVDRPRRRPWLQAAAAVLLVVGGLLGGRYTAGAALLPSTHRLPAPGTQPGSGAEPTARFASVDEARAAQRRAQLTYQSATAFLAALDTSNRAPETPASMRTRLAALDRTRQVMGEALQDSPYDPVINGYYISASGQREATLRQLNTVMPASMRITSY